MSDILYIYLCLMRGVFLLSSTICVIYELNKSEFKREIVKKSMVYAGAPVNI